MIHVTGQLEDMQYWPVVVPDDLEVKSLLVSEFTMYYTQRTWEYRERSVKSDTTSGGRAW